MIPKKPAPDLIRGGNRFSEKITRNTKTWSGMMTRREVIPLQVTAGAGPDATSEDGSPSAPSSLLLHSSEDNENVWQD
jgi:hypothetical protein